jgi:error-prone DNA polymerase
VHKLVDRSDELRRLSEPELPFSALLAPSDEKRKGGPGGSVRQPGSGGHPRNVRILPKSRDFH